jgi:hypothetical protein
MFRVMEVEHLLPQHLEEATVERLKADYKRSIDFKLTDFQNLAPSCGNCNRLKGVHVFKEMPLLATLLDISAKRVPEIERLIKVAEGERVESSIITMMRAGHKSGSLDDVALKKITDYGEKLLGSSLITSSATANSITIQSSAIANNFRPVGTGWDFTDLRNSHDDK